MRGATGKVGKQGSSKWTRQGFGARPTTDSHVAEVGVDAEQIPAPSEQHKQGRDGERRHERASGVF